MGDLARGRNGESMVKRGWNPVLVREVRQRFRGPRSFVVLTLMLIALAAVGGTAAAPSPASASPAAQWDDEALETTPPGFEWSARPIFDGHFRPNAWTGAEFTLSNDGVGRDVEVVVQDVVSKSVSRVSVEMPTGSRKRTVVPFRPEGGALGYSVYVDSDGWRSATRPLGLQEYVEAVLIIGDEDPRLTGLEGLMRRSTSAPSFILAPVEDFPDHALLLRSFEHIILVGGFSRASEAQRLTLERWVRLGGQLTLLGGARASEAHAGLPESLRPAVFEGVEETPNLLELGVWVGAVFRQPSHNSVDDGRRVGMQNEDSDAAVLDRPAQVSRLRPAVGATVELAKEPVAAESGPLPLVVSMLVGDGIVVALAVDPGAPPLRGWENDRRMWAKLRSERPGGVLQEIANEPSFPAQLATISSRAGQAELPSPASLIIVLAIYVAVVGPLNYLVLKRKGRLDLAWLSIPILTLSFTLLSYGMGYRVHGGRLITSQSALIRVPAGGGVAHVQGWFDIRSPADRSYDIELDQAWAFRPVDKHGGSLGITGFISSFDGTGMVEDLRVEQWSQDGIGYEAVVEWPLIAEGSTSTLEVSASGGAEGTLAEGSLVSPFVDDLQHARLIQGRHSLSLGSLRGSDAVAVSDRLEDLPSSRSFAGAHEGRSQIAAAFYAGGIMPYDRFEGPFMELPPADQVDVAVPLNDIRFSGNNVFLAGWSDEPPVRLEIAGRRADTERTALWLSRVPTEGEERGLLSASADWTEIPDFLELMPSEEAFAGPIQNDDTWPTSCEWPGFQMSINVPEIEFELPVEVRFEYDELWLQFSVVGPFEWDAGPPAIDREPLSRRIVPDGFGVELSGVHVVDDSIDHRMAYPLGHITIAPEPNSLIVSAADVTLNEDVMRLLLKPNWRDVTQPYFGYPGGMAGGNVMESGEAEVVCWALAVRVIGANEMEDYEADDLDTGEGF